jgi:hypothetical protein
MPFVEGGIVVDAEPQQQAAPTMAQGGFVQGGIEVDPTPEDSYNKVLQFQAAQTDYTPSKQEFLDYLKVSKTKPLLGEKPLETIGTAAAQTAVDIATMPYKLGEAIGQYIDPQEGIMPTDVALGTAAEIAVQSRLKGESMARGAYDVALSNLEKLTGKLRSDDDRYEAFLATSEIKRQLARANAPEEERVPAAQEFLQAYNIPQEAISQPGLEVGGFLADPSSIAFAGGGKAASMLLQRAAPLIPRAGAALQRGGERIAALGRAPETGAGAFAARVTGSPQMGQAVQEAIARGTTGVALGEAAGLPITAQLNVPGLGTVSRIIGGTKAAGATMETLGEAGAISGGQALTLIQRGLLGAGERIAAAEGASAGARAFGTALARSGLETPIKTAASILIPAAGAAAGGGLLAGLTGEEGEAVAAAVGSGLAFGGIDAGFRLAKAASSDALNANRVKRTAVDDLNTRPTEVQFTYIDPTTGAEQLSTIKDSEARAKLYAGLDNKQLTKALSEVAGAENSGVEVIFHGDGDTVPTSLQSVNYAGVSIGPDNIKSGKPTILINVDRAKPETLPHEILHARITGDVVSRLGSQVIETSAQSPEFQRQFTDFANRYADKLQASGAPIVADRIRTELRDAFDPALQRAQRIEQLKRMTDEFAAYYTQEFLKGKDPKTLLPGRIPSFFELAFNNAKEAVSERFTRQALQNGFDPVARTFYDANGKRIKIPWMEDAIKNLVTPKEGYEPTEQRVDINKLTQAQQNAVIMARGYSDLFMTGPDGSIIRPLSKAELAAKTADVANRTMQVIETVPQNERGSVSGLDAKGNPIIEGRLSLAEADAVSKSGIFSPSTSRSLIDIATAIRDGTLMEGKYWKVYGSTGKSGVFGESEKLFLPYEISINSKGGVNIKAVDWGKVQARMYKALTKPAYKNLFGNYDQAMSTLKDVYLKNIAEQNAAPSAEALGGGIEGAKKRNFFNEVMGAVPKKGDTMINLPTAGYEASRKGGSVYQDLRIERIQNTNTTGTEIPWSGDMGEQSSYRRTQLNFQPAEQVGETSVQSDLVGGYRILSKGGKFRLYGPDGSTAGIFDTEGQAKLKAEKDYATQARLQPEVRQQQYPARDEVRQTAEAGRGDRNVGRTQGREEGRQELGAVRQAGDVSARFMAASEADPSQPSTQAIRSVKGQRAVNSLYQFDYTYKTKTPGKPSREKTATETISAFSISEAKEKAKAAIMKELTDDPTVLRSTISISQPEIKGQFAVTELTGKPADPKSPKIVLNPGTPQKFASMFNAVDAALDLVKDSPALGLDSDGWIKAYSRALNGSRASVPPAPLRLAQWVQDNGAFRKFIEDGLQRNPELVKSAVGGLNALQPIHELARQGQIPSKMVALHMFWGLLSRMLDPYNQEAGWARLTSEPKVLRLIEDSVEGRYKFSKDQWKEIVSTKMSEFPDVSVGRNAIQNANAFHEMLSRWNGRWDELTGIINNPDLTGPQMRRQFNEKGFGGAGIKHKVLSFVLATLARNDVFVGDRWQVVNLWFQHLEKAAAARKAQGGSTEVFAYDRNGVPEDTTGAYKVIGGMLNNETVAETAYSLIENGMRKIAAESPWLREMLGREPQPFDIHWLTWNIIKNEPVGHSSLDATAKFLTENLYGDPEFAQKFAETEKRTEKYAKGVFDVFSVKGQERPQIRQRSGADDGGTGASGLGPDAGRNPGGPTGPSAAAARAGEVGAQRYMPAANQREVGRNIDFANPPTEEKAKAALSSSKQPFWREHESLPEGSPVGVRIDIPAFLNRGTYVQTIHEPATPGNVGDRIGYDTNVRLSGPVRFFVKEGSEESKLGAVAIKEGRAAKHPIATVEGRLIKDRSIPSDIETWTPVGMDPKKHSYFYDKRTDQPVTGGSESFSVGNTVFVKNPVYGKPQDFRYMPSPDSAMPGAYSFQGGYRALPGKTKGSFRIYGPAGSLIGIASSLDEAQRILRRKAKQ